MNSIKLPSRLPLLKLSAGAVSAALVLVIVFILRQFDISMPADVQSALGVLTFLAVSYIVPIQVNELYPAQPEEL